MSNVEIKSAMTGMHSKVFIDGIKQERIVSLNLDMSVDNANLLTINQYPDSLDINVDAVVAEINHKARTEVIRRINEMLLKQTEKGIAKYGHTLDDCPDEKFDWRLMAMEELIDLAQYQQKEIMRLERLLNPIDQ